MGITTEAMGTEADLNEAAVREAFNAAVAEDGRALPAIATEAGISYSTLAAWKNANYKGDNNRITGQVYSWLTTREARQRTALVFPELPSFLRTSVSDGICDVMEAAQTLPDIAIIDGASGIGKTTTAKQYQRRAANVWLATMEPCHKTLGSVLMEISRAVGTSITHSAPAMAGEIRRRMTGTRGLLIIDEAQNLSFEAMDQVRSFHDSAQIGIVMMGTETIGRRFGSDRLTPEFAPLFRRVGQKYRQKNLPARDLKVLLDAWKLDDAEAGKAALSIGRLPGAAGAMIKTLKMAFMLAHAADRGQPNKNDVDAAWAQLGARAEGGAA